MTDPSNTVQPLGRIVIKRQAPYRVIKGPFVCHEVLYQDELGDEKIHLLISLLPTGLAYHWPKKRVMPVPALDGENLPILWWREFDHAPYTKANSGIDHAPRGCFIWRSSFENQPPHFVSVSMDRQLPNFLTNGRLLAGAALLYLVGCVFYLTHRCLTLNHSRTAWDFDSRTFARALELVEVSTLLIGAGLLGFLLLMKLFGVSMRSALLVNSIVARLIWRGYKCGKPFPLIAPTAHAAPWKSLEGFEVKHDPKNPDIPYSTTRRRIRASFGRAAPETDIVNGTLHDDSAREMLRLLTSTFLDKRKHYLAQLEEGPQPLTPEAERLEILRKVGGLMDQRKESLKTSAQLTNQAARLKKNPDRASEAEDLERQARQLDDEIKQTGAEIQPLVIRLNELKKFL